MLAWRRRHPCGHAGEGARAQRTAQRTAQRSVAARVDGSVALKSTVRMALITLRAAAQRLGEHGRRLAARAFPRASSMLRRPRAVDAPARSSFAVGPHTLISPEAILV